MGDGVAGGDWARRPTTVGGGAAARATPFYIFFVFFSAYFSPLSVSNAQNPNKNTQWPRSTD